MMPKKPDLRLMRFEHGLQQGGGGGMLEVEKFHWSTVREQAGWTIMRYHHTGFGFDVGFESHVAIGSAKFFIAPPVDALSSKVVVKRPCA